MNEQPSHETGSNVVDDVLAALTALDGRPVDEHVAGYEQAHESLRRALDDASHHRTG